MSQYEYNEYVRSRNHVEKSIMESGGIITGHTLRHNGICFCAECKKEISEKWLKKRGAYICAKCDKR